AVTRRAKVAPAERMSKFLKHFTVVGDDYHAWNINYKKFQVIIICLVVLDALLVLAELVLDLKIIQPDKNNYAARVVFHYMSIAILTFFMMEIFFKIFVFRLEFFHHKFEILDAIVVVVSFVLDYHGDPRNYFSGIIISVKTRSERQLLRLKQINIQLATKIQHLEFSCSEKEQEIERLNKLLRQNGLLGEVN
ncbi:hypothetical protein E2I00_006917, partial [Balaenoptera physalus]